MYIREMKVDLKATHLPLQKTLMVGCILSFNLS